MLKKTIALTPQRILALSRPEEIIAFFAELGYHTDLHSSPEIDMALCKRLHTNDDLRRKIKAFRRVAENTDVTSLKLCVYLYVLNSSLTTRTRQDIADDLRKLNRDDFLFVLTNETFSDLEFVYLDPVQPTMSPRATQQTLFDEPEKRLGPRRVRNFSVNSRHPSRVALRFLRGLSYTQNDIWEQCKAISRAFDTAETSEEYFNNRSLFSDYYLNERLPKDVPEWLKTEDAGREKDEMEEANAKLRALYSLADRKFADKPLDELRTTLFEPVLSELGFPAQAGRTPQKRASKDGKSQPDYLFELPNQDGTSTRVIGKVYPWGRVLDDYLESDEDDEEARLLALETNENPAAVVVSLLEQEQAQWAILSNGKNWRLYSPKARSRATNYYEIDLHEILTIPRQDADEAFKAFRYFWLFFRSSSLQAKQRAGFEAPPYISLLDFLMRESEQFARELGDSLKKRVFDQIFPYFAEGFVRYAQKTGKLTEDMKELSEEERAQRLKPYFEGTLTFLYRLLVLFYAESRALLPVYDERYHASSLTQIKEEIKKIAGDNKVQAHTNIDAKYSDDWQAIGLYKRLQTLFEAIDRGSEDLNVPAYNGGLFLTEIDKEKARERWTPDEQAAAFLLTHAIPDRYLAQGIDLMARDEDSKKPGGKAELKLVFVDYKTLGVRQLGSIYEGLLEFKLRVAVERMVEVKGKIMPLPEATEKGLYIEGKTRARIYEPRDVYIENDRHERKTTGSYYTPDYVVQYIIEQTVGPILLDKFEKLRDKFRRFQLELANRQKDDDKRRNSHMLPQGVKNIYDKYQELTEEFFDIKVLDPAMGSGHFLVNAADYITDRMTEFLDEYRPNPIQFDLQQIRSSILQEVEHQRVTIDRGRLTELNLLKRQVLKRCIFGVDANHMAVTLTKVSLWLDTFTQGAPFSFLDYHLKWGNSLLGSNLDVLEKALEGRWYTLDLMDVLSSTHVTRMLSRGTDSTPREVKEAQALYDQALERLKPYKTLMNVWVSEYFGNKQAQETAEIFAGKIIKRQDSAIPAFNQTIIAKAQKIADHVDTENIKGKGFFHWDLEFPEVFFDENRRKDWGQAGFDAIIGNPPYVRQEGLGEDKVAFKEIYKEIYNSIADLYTYFIMRGHMLLRQDGLFGMITANKFMRANYGAGLRSFLIEKVALQKLIDFGDLPVFGDATTYPIIIISANAERNSAPIEYALLKNLEFESLSAAIKPTIRELPASAFNGNNWSLAHGAEQGILKKLLVNTVSLQDFVGGKIRRGIITGFNEAFIIDKATREKLIKEDPKSEEIIKPFLVGEDIHRYFVNYQDRYLIWTYIGVPINEYPAIYKHLQQYQAQLEKRWDKGNHWWELRHCDYYPDFENPKIVYPVIAMSNKFALDEDHHYTNDKTFFIPIKDFYLLSILNSSTLFFFFRNELSKLRGGFLEYRGQTLVHTPIRNINFITPSDQRNYYLEKAKLLYNQCTSKNDQDCVLGFVKHHLSKQPEESDVVHDLLAYLAEEMIRLNQEKRAEQQAFLAWLVDTLKIQPQPDKKTGKVGIDALQGKARLIDYPGDYLKDEKELDFVAIKNILLDNKKRLGVYLSDSLLTHVAAQYQRSLDKVLPLKKQLKQTDELIDQIVYKLYGLSEEEINIIEGKR